jgi:hypothetical protein
MAIGLLRTRIKNLGAPRRLHYILPNGKFLATNEEIFVPGVLESTIALSQRPALIAQLQADLDALLVEVEHFIGLVPIGTANVTATDAKFSILNVDMNALTTTADGDLACATPILEQPKYDSFISVVLNGAVQRMAKNEAERTSNACYFSNDGGLTAVNLSNITIGDELYWNGSVAGYELQAVDKFTFLYLVNSAGVVLPTVASMGDLPVSYLGDRDLIPNTVPALNEQDTGIVVSGFPIASSTIDVYLNGVPMAVSDGDKTGEFYFTGDSNVSARALTAIQHNDKLYFNGVVAGFGLDNSIDSIDLTYLVRQATV